MSYRVPDPTVIRTPEEIADARRRFPYRVTGLADFVETFVVELGGRIGDATVTISRYVSIIHPGVWAYQFAIRAGEAGWASGGDFLDLDECRGAAKRRARAMTEQEVFKALHDKIAADRKRQQWEQMRARQSDASYHRAVASGKLRR